MLIDWNLIKTEIINSILSQINVLGVTIDHDLRFDDHIQNINKSISNNIKFVTFATLFTQKNLKFDLQITSFPYF
jgi:uncharacterized UPF0160 family protein